MFENPGQSAEPLGGMAVLLADDEERLRTVVEMMLEELGAEVIVAEDGAAALAAFDHQPGKIGAVLLDLRMRGLDGLAVLDGLRKIDPGVPVLLTSGAAPDEEVLRRIVRAGCGFIEKPFDVDALGEAFRAVIAGRPAVRRSR
jgi:DNA-binding NtrC family response regulator